MRTSVLIAGGLMVATGSALAACSGPPRAEAAGAPETVGVTVRVAPAVATRVGGGATASGLVEARTTVDVAFQVPGRVAAVGPDEGDAVSAGQLLAALDATEYRLGAEQADAQAEQATHERERFRPLLAVGSVSPRDMERLETSARAGIAAAGLARKHLADARLVSPIAGVVARRAIEVGESAAPGQVVFTIMDLDPVRVRVGVPERVVGHARVGQAATVRIPALGDSSLVGRVSLVGVAADPTTRSYAVEVSVPNHDRRIKAGMIAEATVDGDAPREVVTVPASAVVRGPDGASVVYVLGSGARQVRARAVTPGTVRGDAIEIASGLTAGELVVVAGQQRVRDGAAVAVTGGAR